MTVTSVDVIRVVCLDLFDFDVGGRPKDTRPWFPGRRDVPLFGEVLLRK